MFSFTGLMRISIVIAGQWTDAEVNMMPVNRRGRASVLCICLILEVLIPHMFGIFPS